MKLNIKPYYGPLKFIFGVKSVFQVFQFLWQFFIQKQQFLGKTS